MRRGVVSILFFSLVVVFLAFLVQSARFAPVGAAVQAAAAQAAQPPRYAVLLAGRQGRTPAHASAAPAAAIKLGTAAKIVGDGTPGSCTALAVQTALAGGGEIGFNCGAAPISLPGGPYAIADPTTLDGGGLVTLDGENTHRIFEVAAGVPLTLTNLALSGGAAAGGNGGAVWNQGRLALRGGLYTNNSAAGGGGGVIFNDGGALDIRVGPLSSPWYNPTFSGNQAASGGAIAASGSLSISGAVFEQNAATAGEGGALQLLSGASAALYNITARYNSASDGGGAFAFAAASSASLDFIDIFYNTVSGPAAGGGGIENAGALTARLLWLDSNAAFQGGALYNQGDFSRLEQSTLSNNSATRGGGVYTSGTLLLENATLSANTASEGGGLFNAGGASAVRFSTWKNNSADSGGTLDVNQGALTLYASLFAEDTCASTGGALTSQGYNVQPGASCSLDNPNDRPNQDPRLAELNSNGGWQYTHALLYGSPAIDLAPSAGCPAFDQVGTARPVGPACDGGALEMVTLPPSPTPTATPTTQPPPPPTNPNFIVLGMEINQGIQNMSNDVPLVSQKRTLLRVYVRNASPVASGPDQYAPWATLSYTNFSYTNIIYPRKNAYINNITGPFNRGSIYDDVYEFEIPTYDLSGIVQFHFELNPIYWHRNPLRLVRDVTETNYADNTLDKFFTFSPVNTMNLRVLDVPYTINNITYLPTALDHQRLEAWLRNAYPISALNVIYTPYPTTFTTQPTTDAMLDLIAFYRNLLRPPNNEHWYAMVSDAGFPCVNRAKSFSSPDCFMRGLASGLSAVGPAGTWNWGWDNDNSYAD